MCSRSIIGIVCLALLPGCNTSEPATPLTPGERSAITDTVRTLVHQYVSLGNSPTICSNPTPMLKLIGFVEGTSLYASGSTIGIFSRPDVEGMVKQSACSRRSLSGRVDSVIVQVLSRDVAIAAWTFDETKVDSLGRSERIKGAVLHSWLRGPDGWSATAWMDSHVPVPK